MLKKTIFISALATLMLFSCSKKNESMSADSTLKLNIVGVEDLGTTAKYEGWIMVDGKPVSTGTFTVNSLGVMSTTEFMVKSSDLTSASKFILTIEPFPDTDPAPASTHLVAGTFVSNVAALSISALEALGTDFTSSIGNYVLATPSDGEENNEKSGVWFLGSLPPSAGLILPTLPEGWVYEGWAVINNTPVSTGTFTSASGADMFNGFSGTEGTPAFPGEDFVKNAPAGLTFPTDLSGGKVVISVEPSPDNSPKPFLLKPLIADVPTDAVDHKVYSLENKASATVVSGVATK